MRQQKPATNSKVHIFHLSVIFVTLSQLRLTVFFFCFLLAFLLSISHSIGHSIHLDPLQKHYNVPAHIDQTYKIDVNFFLLLLLHPVVAIKQMKTKRGTKTRLYCPIRYNVTESRPIVVNSYRILHITFVNCKIQTLWIIGPQSANTLIWTRISTKINENENLFDLCYFVCLFFVWLCITFSFLCFHSLRTLFKIFACNLREKENESPTLTVSIHSHSRTKILTIFKASYWRPQTQWFQVELFPIFSLSQTLTKCNCKCMWISIFFEILLQLNYWFFLRFVHWFSVSKNKIHSLACDMHCVLPVFSCVIQFSNSLSHTMRSADSRVRVCIFCMYWRISIECFNYYFSKIYQYVTFLHFCLCRSLRFLQTDILAISSTQAQEIQQTFIYILAYGNNLQACLVSVFLVVFESFI